MDAYLLDWANLLLRWAHVITAHRLDRLLVLLRLPRHQPDAAGRPERSRPRASTASCGRCTAAASTTRRSTRSRRRRCPSTCTGSTGRATRPGSPASRCSRCSYLCNAGTFLIDKTVIDWSPAAAIGAALAFLVAFWIVYDAHLPRLRPRARTATRSSACWCSSFVVVAAVAGLPAVRRPRRLPAGRRDDRHGDERQRVLLDHPGPAQGRRAAAGGPAGRPDARPARQAAQRAQHLLHAAGAVRDAVSNHYGFALRRAAQLARAGR